MLYFIQACNAKNNEVPIGHVVWYYVTMNLKHISFKKLCIDFCAL
jgi:hypothetical protein